MSASLPARAEPTRPTLPEDHALGALRTTIAARLARVCADMPAGDFARLVDRIARFTWRWQLRDTPRRATV